MPYEFLHPFLGAAPVVLLVIAAALVLRSPSNAPVPVPVRVKDRR